MAPRKARESPGEAQESPRAQHSPKKAPRKTKRLSEALFELCVRFYPFEQLLLVVVFVIKIPPDELQIGKQNSSPRISTIWLRAKQSKATAFSQQLVQPRNALG
jgi:hypothetical protein